MGENDGPRAGEMGKEAQRRDASGGRILSRILTCTDRARLRKLIRVKPVQVKLDSSLEDATHLVKY
jgi:hypothetical protein